MLFVLIGTAAFYLYQRSSGFQEVEFMRLEDFRIEKINTFPNLNLQAKANARLNNPNPFSVEIRSTEFDIFIEDKHASRANQSLSIEMKRNSDFELPLDFEIPLGKIGFFKDARNILSGAWKNQSIKMRTVGRVKVSVLGLEVDVPFEEETSYLLKDYLPK